MSPQELAEVLDELSKVDSLDLTAKRELLEELSSTPQKEWSTLVRRHRLRAAYNKQLAALEQPAPSVEQSTLEQPTQNSLATTPRTKTPTISPPASASFEQTTPVQDGLVIAKRTIPIRTIISAVTPTNPTAIKMQLAPTPTATPIRKPAFVTKTPPAPLQVLSKPPQQPLPVVQPASFVSTKDWQGHLQNAVHKLQASVHSDPSTADEVNQHLRLRFLQLLAGDEEAALQTIPGATAKQQDYWNKQLFAVSTYLDSERQPDNKRRAAGALMHLDHARAKLAELATMQVRKLAFVNSVDGYGAYTLHKENKFKAGASITLYAELENFSSESTKAGFRTRLATSYEVLDKNGQRVDSADFPEVEDLCQNLRRDFHMQYTITLPTQIYAAEYTIQLTITDQQSQKIGQASVPFEIVE